MKMKTITLKQLLLYNYRYVFAYVIIVGFIGFFLGWQLSNLGPGLSQPEVVTAARHIHFMDIVHLPIYPLQAVLQFVSIKLLGVTPLALRLPSVIIALLVAFTLYQLLKRWFGKSTALLSTAILISADWFLFIARLGVGGIEFSLWLVLALFCFTRLIEHKSRWLVLFAMAISGLLFAPFGIYAAITLIACLLGFRVFRARTKEASFIVKLLSISVFVLTVAALIFITTLNIQFLKNIFGVQNMPGIMEYFRNLFINTSAVVMVLPNANPVISPNGVFFIRFFELIFILFGVAMLWKTRVNRLNFTVLILSVILVLVSGLSSGPRGGGVILIPAAIYMTAGIRHLIHRWKRTFPKNPYAKIAAFAPLTILFFCVVALHYVIYFSLWPSQPATHVAFNYDLPLLQTELNQSAYKDKSCVVQTNDINMQQLVSASNTVCKVSFEQATPNPTQTVILPGTSNVAQLTVQGTTVTPLVSETKTNNVRWLVLKPSQ